MFDQIDFLFYADNELRVADFVHGISSVTYMTQHPGVLEMSDLLEIMQSKINIHALPVSGPEMTWTNYDVMA